MGVEKRFRLVRCQTCRAILLNPRPTQKELQDFYPREKYYSLEKINPFSVKATLRRLLFSWYAREGTFSSLLRGFLYFLAGNIRTLPSLREKRVLDIGCGSGQFLYELSLRGHDAIGVEPSNFDSEGAKKYGITIHKTDLLRAHFSSEFFDAITMNHVLEHLDTPQETLKEIHRILKEGGTFIIAVPNTDSLAHRLFRESWYQLDVPRHLYNYSEDLLVSLLKKTGFTITQIRHNARHLQFAVSHRYKNYSSKRNRLIEGLVFLFSIPATILTNLLKRGDQIEIICKKQKN